MNKTEQGDEFTVGTLYKQTSLHRLAENSFGRRQVMLGRKHHNLGGIKDLLLQSTVQACP